MFQIRAKIVYNKRVKEHYYLLAVSAGRIASKSAPGQFLEIKVNIGLEPLLRRPFSIHAAEGSLVEILYEVVGEGSRLLSKRKAGEFIDLIGPLGNGFNFVADKPAILVAGGMGVAPLFFLAEKFLKPKPFVLIGAKTKSGILCEKEFKKTGCDVKIATDDGSWGFKGRVTDLLKNLLSTTNYQLLTIYACGPKPMLKELCRIAKQHKIPTQISLEEHMACGIGACLGCVINTKEGFKRVCKEGPVFDCRDLIWQKKGEE